MKALNRNQELTMGSQMRGVRAQIACCMAVLALAGCMQTSQQVSMAPRSDLDAMAYGQPASVSYPVSSADSGGAVSALRASFATFPTTFFVVVLFVCVFLLV